MILESTVNEDHKTKANKEVLVTDGKKRDGFPEHAQRGRSQLMRKRNEQAGAFYPTGSLIVEAANVEMRVLSLPQNEAYPKSVLRSTRGKFLAAVNVELRNEDSDEDFITESSIGWAE